jgi:hypothetical protein
LAGVCTLVLNGRYYARNTPDLIVDHRPSSCCAWVLSPAQGRCLLGWHICPTPRLHSCSAAECLPQPTAACGLLRELGEERHGCHSLPTNAAVWGFSSCCVCAWHLCTYLKRPVQLVAVTAAWLWWHTAESTGHCAIICHCVFMAAQVSWQHSQFSCFGQPGRATRVFLFVCPSATARCALQSWPCVFTACSSLQACREFLISLLQTGVCGSSGKKA